jgi:hypothetical protein
MKRFRTTTRFAAVLDLSWIHSELAPFYPKMGYRNHDRFPQR